MKGKDSYKIVPVVYPPPSEIFASHEAPVIEIDEKYIISYGDETLLANWLMNTFNLEIYEPPLPHEKIQYKLEKLLGEKRIADIELKKILVARDYSWGLLLDFKFPQSLPILNEEGEPIFYLGMVTPYSRNSYLVSDTEREKIDLAKIIEYAPRPTLEKFVERVFEYYEKKIKESENEIWRYIF